MNLRLFAFPMPRSTSTCQGTGDVLHTHCEGCDNPVEIGLASINLLRRPVLDATLPYYIRFLCPLCKHDQQLGFDKERAEQLISLGASVHSAA